MSGVGTGPRATSSIDEDAAAALVEDLEGQTLALRDLWRDQTAVLVFLRHFG